MNHVRSLLSTRPGRLSLALFLAGVAISIWGTVRMVNTWTPDSHQGTYMMYAGAAVILFGVPFVGAHHRRLESRQRETGEKDC